jgi:CubicO group peptidase (beta-lactamase class C family)
MMRLPLFLVFLLLVSRAGLAAASSPLPRGTPEAEGVDSAGVLAFVDALERQVDAVHSIMLVRHGRVVAEGWWSPYAAADNHVMYSVTKSFTSTAIGFAAQEGLLNINDTVLSHFPELAPAEPAANMKSMRIRDLLRMVTGHQEDTMDTLRARADGSWRRAFLETAVENRPGTHFCYNSGGSYMLAALVQKVAGTTVDEFLRPHLFEPLGIEHPVWGQSSEGVALGDGGLYLRTEDLAKFGLLYLQKGVWNGQRLLSESWVEAATSLQTSTGSNPDGNWDAGYGYQFWRNKTTGYRADGAQGQFSFVLPEYDVVLAVTSGTAKMNDIMDIVWQHLLPAFRDVALPANPSADDELTQRLAALVLPVQPGALHSARALAVSEKKYAFESNEQGVTAVAIDFSGDSPMLAITDADGTHAITCGLGHWVRAHTNYQKRINNLFDDPDQGIAACGAWTDENTFSARLCFNETPYTIIMRCAFIDDRLLIDMEQNVRWGPTTWPQLIGTRSP